jgi:hypothetical protein
MIVAYLKALSHNYSEKKPEGTHNESLDNR